MSTFFEGGCLCGTIRYRAAAAPVRGVMCHCEMCRRHSGAPALAFVHFPIESFDWLGPEPTAYRSSQFAERTFCPQCGSTLGMREEVLSNVIQVCIGTLDEPDRVRLNDHVWTRSRIAWFDTTDSLPRFEKSSSAVASKAT
jgi:hypothetical protein